MHRRSRTDPGRARTTLLLLALGLVPSLAVAQSYDLSWYTIDGGGATFSTGGTFQLGGTIGQPDASSFSTPLSGGTFTLVGGFWPAAGQLCTLPGDMNVDGLRDGADIQDFLNCLLATGTNCACADLDGNGAVNVSDVTVFVAALLS